METPVSEYVLSADEKALIDGINAQARELQSDMNAILRAITKARGLQGAWQFDGEKFTRGA